jgi:hypothetical protein
MVERQLDIFGSKRQRGKVVATGPSEFQIHCTVADYLRHGLAPGWIWNHPANGEERPAEFVKGKRVSYAGGRLKRMGLKPGVTDLELHKAPDARLYALELKRRGEKPSEAQYAWMLGVEAIGGVTAWADSVDKAVDILRGWGAIRTGFDIQKNERTLG